MEEEIVKVQVEKVLNVTLPSNVFAIQNGVILIVLVDVVGSFVQNLELIAIGK